MINNIKKYEIKGKVKILTNDKIHIYKKSNKDIKKLEDYLYSRNFTSIPKIIDETIEGYEYEFIVDTDTPKEQKLNDLVKKLSELHLKTSYFKEVGEDKYLEIFEKINENILYIEGYYNDIITNIEKKIYYLPSEQLIARNYCKIIGAINYCKNELLNWKQIVDNYTKQRVCVVHNNLKTEHLLKGEKDYIISWDNSIIDTPIMDLYKLFKNENLINNFIELLELYENKFKLKEDEKKLLFILLSIPKKFDFSTSEFENTKNVRVFIDYLYKMNNLITSYNSKDSKDE